MAWKQSTKSAPAPGQLWIINDLGNTHKRQAAVTASGNLRLIRVDEDLGVAHGTAAAVARDDTIVCPPHRLLVDELDSRIRPRLQNNIR